MRCNSLPCSGLGSQLVSIVHIVARRSTCVSAGTGDRVLWWLRVPRSPRTVLPPACLRKPKPPLVLVSYLCYVGARFGTCFACLPRDDAEFRGRPCSAPGISPCPLRGSRKGWGGVHSQTQRGRVSRIGWGFGKSWLGRV
eukprot:2298101-Prymnesium_polylepis.1